MSVSKGGQHVVAPGVGPIARLKQENRDLKAEVERLSKDVSGLVQDVVKLSVERDNLLELQVAAEAIEGPADWFHKDIRLKIVTLHKAIRKVRGMG